MTKVAIYARVSEEERRERQNTEEQLVACRDCCAKNGHEVVPRL